MTATRTALPTANPGAGIDYDLFLDCIHCGLCAERCPTDAWDMQKSWIEIPHAEDEARCQSARALRRA